MRLKLGALKAMARELRVDPEALEAAIDDVEDPKAVAVQMVLDAEHHAGGWEGEEGVPLCVVARDDEANVGGAATDGFDALIVCQPAVPEPDRGPEPEPELAPPEAVPVVKPQAAAGRKTVVFGQAADLVMVMASDDSVDKMWLEAQARKSREKDAAPGSKDPATEEREWQELEEWHRTQRVQQKPPAYVESAGVYGTKRGVEAGMKLMSVQGQEVSHLSLREATAAIATVSAAGRPLTLVFEHADASTSAAAKKSVNAKGSDGEQSSTRLGKEEKKELKAAAKKKKRQTRAAGSIVKASAKDAQREADAALGITSGAGGKVFAAVSGAGRAAAIAPGGAAGGDTLSLQPSTDAASHEVSGLMGAAGSPITPSVL